MKERSAVDVAGGHFNSKWTGVEIFSVLLTLVTDAY